MEAHSKWRNYSPALLVRCCLLLVLVCWGGGGASVWTVDAWVVVVAPVVIGTHLKPADTSFRKGRQRPLSLELNDDSDARSAFGTKEYWDDVYTGRGDFPADEYSWYYGWETLGPIVQQYVPSKNAHILVPGIGNDPILADLVQSKYTTLTAMDYSEHAVERQQDLLDYANLQRTATIDISVGDVRQLPQDWTLRFDAIVEKGVLDAIYLTGDGHVEQAVENLERVLRPGGIFVSVSGVVPNALRKTLFQDWKWLRDGSDDLKAGCFVFQKK